ncbi:hypothetical protein FH779_11080 [Empedobacter falsenii]|uniref:WG repeat-containing protein n=2 Tax=Weeksellaceae TaxID=2762318 RepID=A0A7H9DV53_9FLAO|nr:hypothetical protein FH779_11080 [Empedobacter falsenii]
MHVTNIMMNKIIFTSLLSTLLFTNVNAQMIIAEEGNYPTSVITESTLLQFEDNNSKGIILPANDSAPQNPSNGTFVFDMSDIKVKMYENGQWVNLTDRGNYPYGYNDYDIGEGVIIGAETSTADGVLVLESPDKALVLPRVNNLSTDVVSPYPGMMCYDLASKTVAIFDGVQWSYWN